MFLLDLLGCGSLDSSAGLFSGAWLAGWLLPMHFFFPLQGLHHLSFPSMPYKALHLGAEDFCEVREGRGAAGAEAGREEETREARGESATVAWATEVTGEAGAGGEGLDLEVVEEVEAGLVRPGDVRPVRPGDARLILAGDTRRGKAMTGRMETLWCLVLLFFE
jgi:hypothetical protein